MHAVSNLLIALLNSSTAVHAVLQHWQLTQLDGLAWAAGILGVTTFITGLLWFHKLRKLPLLQAEPTGQTT